MDDILSGADDITTAKEMQRQLIGLMKEGLFSSLQVERQQTASTDNHKGQNDDSKNLAIKIDWDQNLPRQEIETSRDTWPSCIKLKDLKIPRCILLKDSVAVQLMDL
ncbi:hypothetical protein TNCT_299581 [Trichonephila clavata]|uniref:Uncharacterized protein n=1 Tax=Trichonephila clavata TaxID=2740835 RepID=A0A8X6FCY7_TRICU|nr:hypothetical protein TNCT_299581 [Trichonephila clavata]